MLLVGANNSTYRKLMLEDVDNYGFLIQPRSYAPNNLIKAGVKWAMDNDAYNDFSEERFLSMLRRMMPYKDKCIFVVSPDVVGNHNQTLELFFQWRIRIPYPVAFVLQDGATLDSIPWEHFTTLFVGGTDELKDKCSPPFIREAQKRGKWVHVGRVNNSESRLKFCLEMGVDSIDGTSYAIAPTKNLNWYHNQIKIWNMQRRLL